MHARVLPNTSILFAIPTKRNKHVITEAICLLCYLQEADDLRKRTRQERLAELRTGKRSNWVHLHRQLPR
jgi:hypothetical protein